MREARGTGLEGLCPYCGNAVDGGGAQGGPTIEVGDDSVVKETRPRQGKTGESEG
ncbi:MAG TPA: hypothetical protein HPP84_11805 [Rhodospirillaceae bacterium]|nr:hypothetical protein [Rhodospirillaceae bacterium]HIJ94026.1 hypothetical protein [Rhodospirillaceae bacterium]